MHKNGIKWNSGGVPSLSNLIEHEAEKKILISCNRVLDFGGVEKSVTSFLRAFDTERYAVTLVLREAGGAFYSLLPKEQIQIRYTSDIDPKVLLREDLSRLRILRILKGMYHRVVLRLTKDWYTDLVHSYHIIKYGLDLEEHYSCAISYTTTYSDLSIVSRADADYKIAFVHGDATQRPWEAKRIDALVRKMDLIYAVSESAKQQFLQMHPACQNVEVFPNIIEPAVIRQNAQEAPEGMDLTTSGIRICTVGRFAPEKGQMLIPTAAGILKYAGIPFKWYLVGDGPLREELEKKIAEQGLIEEIILLGAKFNPYPYMRCCDLYVQPSYTEAEGITIKEALVLGKPIVATKIDAFRLLLKDGNYGLLTNISGEGLADGIRAWMEHPERTQTNLSAPNYDYREQMDWLYEKIDGS